MNFSCAVVVSCRTRHRKHANVCFEAAAVTVPCLLSVSVCMADSVQSGECCWSWSRDVRQAIRRVAKKQRERREQQRALAAQLRESSQSGLTSLLFDQWDGDGTTTLDDDGVGVGGHNGSQASLAVQRDALMSELQHLKVGGGGVATGVT